jgi:hypothetical protein
MGVRKEARPDGRRVHQRSFVKLYPFLLLLEGLTSVEWVV